MTKIKTIPAGVNNTVPVDGPGNYVNYENPGTIVGSAYNGFYQTDDVGYDHASMVDNCIGASVWY